jgi:hercynylcysteine S-oxide lyase
MKELIICAVLIVSLTALHCEWRRQLSDGRYAVDFGHRFRRHYFSSMNSSDGVVHVNQGSFGATPDPVQAAHLRYLQRAHSHADRWFRLEAPVLLERVRRRLATLLNTGEAAEEGGDDEQRAGRLVLVENASVGMNTVLRSLNFERGDCVLSFSVAYDAVKREISFVADRFRLRHVELNVTLPLLGDAAKLDLLAMVDAALAIHSPRLFVFSEIASKPAIRLPVRELVELCRARGVQTLVDGAHSLGSIPIDVQALGCDYYVANAHKWLFSPRTTALLFVARDAERHIHPLTISHAYDELGSRIVSEFAWRGTRDVSATLAIGDALDFRERVCGGEQRIREHNEALCTRAANMMAARFNTSLAVAPSLTVANLRNVQVPCVSNSGALCHPLDFESRLSAYLLEVGRFAPPFRVPAQPESPVYVRISCQLYNELSDYELLAQSIERFVFDYYQ